MNGSLSDKRVEMPIQKLTFFFLILFMICSFVDMNFSLGGKGFFSVSEFELCSYLLMLALVATACMQSFPAGAVAALFGNAHRWLHLYLIWGVIAVILVRGDAGKDMLIDLKKVLPCMVGYFGIILMATSYKKAKALLVAWIAAGMVNVLLAFSQFFLGGPHPVKAGENALEKLDIGGKLARNLVTGFFSHPNLFSQIIISYFVVFTTAWLISDKLFSPKSLRFLTLGAVFGCVLLLTLAKGAILWSFIAIVMGVSMARWDKLRSRFFFVSFWILCIAAINSIALLLVFDIVQYDSLRTLFSRIQFIIAAFNIFLDHPLNAVIGGGMRYWVEYSAIWAVWEYPNAHNVYVNQMLSYGIIGLVLFFSFLVAHVKRGMSAPLNSADPIMSPLPYLAAVFALTGSYFFEPSFVEPTQKFQLFFLLAMCFTLAKRQFSKGIPGKIATNAG